MIETAEWSRADAHASLRKPTASDDKYSRGVLGVRTGSERYPGAAVLGVEAAWRTGLGMVRYLGAERATALVLQRRPETVTADGRVQGWLIGSGTDASDRSATETTALRQLLAGTIPVVVDAGALDLAVDSSAPRIVTPHGSEHARLRAMLGLDEVEDDADDDAREAAALQTAAALGAVVLLKGAVTIVATPGGWVRRVRAASPWLATAGTGDVLGGAIGAVLAGAHLDQTSPWSATERVERLGAVAATGAWLHGRAARRASRIAAGTQDDEGPDASTGGPITALDVAESLPAAVAEALATN